MKKYKWIIISVIAILAITASIELSMGRLPWGPDGKIGLWEGNIWSSEQSQRFADPYTFSHMIHGMLFYAFLWLVAKRLPLKYRLITAFLLEAGWEILENSPLIINRYREVTISLGYVGDSVFNSLSDILMAGFGFFLAYKFPTWLIIVLIIIMEVGTLFWVRDNLTLNIIMLMYPIDAIKNWQSVGHLLPQ
ncbi:DUF2585 family protein [Candidatus Peregrinibacteria bacterium]|nr:DUF2585 family protein [Candidatus Peregrinibacteria bacterium]